MQISKKLCLIVLFLGAGFLVSCSTEVREPSETELEIHAFLDTYEQAWESLSQADLDGHVSEIADGVRITHPHFLALAELYLFPYETGIDDDGNVTHAGENDWHRAQITSFSYFVVKVEKFKLSNRRIVVNADTAFVKARQTMKLIKDDEKQNVTTTMADVTLTLNKIAGVWRVSGEYNKSN